MGRTKDYITQARVDSQVKRKKRQQRSKTESARGRFSVFQNGLKDAGFNALTLIFEDFWFRTLPVLLVGIIFVFLIFTDAGNTLLFSIGIIAAVFFGLFGFLGDGE